MPIYEYRCSVCGHQEDHLLKLSDAPLTRCPACGKKKYEKQLTAAGFQLKGSGWYATDFKGGKKPAEVKPDAKPGAQADAKTEAKSEAKSETKTEAKPDAKSEVKSEKKTEAKVDKKAPVSTAN